MSGGSDDYIGVIRGGRLRGGGVGKNARMTTEPGPKPPSPLEYASDGTTLVEVTNAFEAQGFSGQMMARPGGMIRCVSCNREHLASETLLHALRRTEGASDPDDMAAVVALECPHCHSKGTAVLAFGPTATPDDDEVLGLLEDRRQDSNGDGVTTTS